MISSTQLKIKRIFDVLLAVLLLPILFIPIMALIILSTLDTKTFGIYRQQRVGQHGKLFYIYKLRTLREKSHHRGYLDNSPSVLGRFLRQSKLNELPQLFNVLKGDMSFVGPRPDVVGFADELEGEDRIILKVKPGITGPATLKYKDEERVLERQKDPEHYNRTIIWVDKVKINKNYVRNYSFYLDLIYILKSTLNK